jgi:hypothetical protein
MLEAIPDPEKTTTDVTAQHKRFEAQVVALDTRILS